MYFKHLGKSVALYFATCVDTLRMWVKKKLVIGWGEVGVIRTCVCMQACFLKNTACLLKKKVTLAGSPVRSKYVREMKIKLCVYLDILRGVVVRGEDLFSLCTIA